METTAHFGAVVTGASSCFIAGNDYGILYEFLG
jgi:hypothetical protein